MTNEVWLEQRAAEEPAASSGDRKRLRMTPEMAAQIGRIEEWAKIHELEHQGAAMLEEAARRRAELTASYGASSTDAELTASTQADDSDGP